MAAAEIRVTLLSYRTVLDHLVRKEWKPVVLSPELFWTSFCYAWMSKEKPNKRWFAVSMNEENLQVTGQEHIIKGIQDVVEVFRKYVTSNLSREIRNTAIVAVQIAGDFRFYPETDTPVLDCRDWLDRAKTPHSWFNADIRPALPELFRQLGATYTEAEGSRKCDLGKGLSMCEESSIRMDISLNKKHDLYHEIPPISISEPLLPEGFYEQWKRGQFCDYTLVTQERTKIPVQASVLHALGGDGVRSWFRGDFREGAAKEIAFPDTPEGILRAALEFIYRGEAVLTPEAIVAAKIPLFELYVFAQKWQIEGLVDHCVNLISLMTSASDVIPISDLNEKVPHEHLEKLIAHYGGDPRKAAGGAAAGAGRA